MMRDMAPNNSSSLLGGAVKTSAWSSVEAAKHSAMAGAAKSVAVLEQPAAAPEEATKPAAVAVVAAEIDALEDLVLLLAEAVLPAAGLGQEVLHQKPEHRTRHSACQALAGLACSIRTCRSCRAGTVLGEHQSLSTQRG